MIAIEIFLLTLLSLAAYIDIKTYEVPDLLSYSLFFSGLIYVISNALFSGDFFILVYALISLALAWVISMSLFLTGQWGGGDVKMLYGMSLFLGFNVSIFNLALPAILVFFFLTMLSGAVFGVFWMVYHVFFKWSAFKKEFKKLNHTNFSKHSKKAFLFSGIFILIISPFIQFNLLFILFSFFIYLLFLFYLIIFTKAAEKSTSVKKVPISSLVEGDWIVDKEGLDASKKYNVSSTGITAKEIDSLSSKGIKKVYIKNGVPFLPSFLIGYVIFLLI